MKNKAPAKYFFLEGGGGGQIICIMGNVEVANWKKKEKKKKKDIPMYPYAYIGMLLEFKKSVLKHSKWLLHLVIHR